MSRWEEERVTVAKALIDIICELREELKRAEDRADEKWYQLRAARQQLAKYGMTKKGFIDFGIVSKQLVEDGFEVEDFLRDDLR